MRCASQSPLSKTPRPFRACHPTDVPPVAISITRASIEVASEAVICEVARQRLKMLRYYFPDQNRHHALFRACHPSRSTRGRSTVLMPPFQRLTKTCSAELSSMNSRRFDSSCSEKATLSTIALFFKW